MTKEYRRLSVFCRAVELMRYRVKELIVILKITPLESLMQSQNAT